MNNTIKTPQKSSDSPKNPQNTTGLSDKSPNSTDKSAISRIAGDFGNLSQDKLNFAAHISVIPVQKIMIGGEL